MLTYFRCFKGMKHFYIIDKVKIGDKTNKAATTKLVHLIHRSQLLGHEVHMILKHVKLVRLAESGMMYSDSIRTVGVHRLNEIIFLVTPENSIILIKVNGESGRLIQIVLGKHLNIVAVQRGRHYFLMTPAVNPKQFPLLYYSI